MGQHNFIFLKPIQLGYKSVKWWLPVGHSIPDASFGIFSLLTLLSYTPCFNVSLVPVLLTRINYLSFFYCNGKQTCIWRHFLLPVFYSVDLIPRKTYTMCPCGTQTLNDLVVLDCQSGQFGQSATKQRKSKQDIPCLILKRKIFWFKQVLFLIAYVGM